MKHFIYILPALVASITALPSASTPTNLLKDPGLESYPKKHLNQRNAVGATGKGYGGWAVSGEAVILSNDMSPSSPTPYGTQFARLQNFTGSNPQQGGAIVQSFAVPQAGNYTTTFRYRITQAPQEDCLISSFRAGGDLVTQMAPVLSIKPGSTSSKWHLATLTSYGPVEKAKGTVDYAISCAKGSGAWMVDLDQLSFFASD